MTKLWIALTFLFSCTCLAKEVNLTNSYADTVLGKDWKGILFACDPYCRFISIREETNWNPVLTDELLEEKTLKPIAQTDPAYPYLIVQSPVFPFTSQRLKNSLLKKDENEFDKAPPYAVAPFNFGYRISLGPAVSMVNWSSDTSLQSNMKAEGMASGAVVHLDFMKGSPNRIWKFWFQHQLDIAMALVGSYQTADGASVTTSGMELRYQAWIATKTMKHGPRFSYLTEGFKVAEESLNHFSTDQTLMLLGYGFLLGRWNLGLDTALSGNIHDSQNFRQGPFEQTYYRATAGYCTKDLSLFDISFGICSNAYYSQDTQQSSLADGIYVTDQSKIDRTSMGLELLIRIGEDFYR